MMYSTTPHRQVWNLGLMRHPVYTHSELSHIPYCTAQVVNRDISIAVLRYFVKQRQLEEQNGTAAKSRTRVKGAVMANAVTDADKV